MFVAVLFAIAKRWKPPQCPPTGEWTNKCTMYGWRTVSLQKGMKRWSTLRCGWTSEMFCSVKEATHTHHLPHDSIDMTLPEEYVHRNTQKVGSCQGLGRGRIEDQPLTGDGVSFGGNGNVCRQRWSLHSTVNAPNASELDLKRLILYHLSFTLIKTNKALFGLIILVYLRDRLFPSYISSHRCSFLSQPPPFYLLRIFLWLNVGLELLIISG